MNQNTKISCRYPVDGKDFMDVVWALQYINSMDDIVRATNLPKSNVSEIISLLENKKVLKKEKCGTRIMVNVDKRRLSSVNTDINKIFEIKKRWSDYE